MTFTEKQIADLEAKLDPATIRTRKQAGRELSYIEGWHAIAEANRIFGFDAWDRETVEQLKCGEPERVEVYEWDNNTRSYKKAIDKKTGETAMQWRVRFLCRCRVTVYHGDRKTVREGTGYGSGIANDLGDAYESAIKEAETDAMKRALMTFGNPFGLALYDKDQRNVGRDDPAPKPASGKPLSVQTDVRDRLDWSDVLGERPLDIVTRNASQSREPFKALQSEMRQEVTPADLLAWAETKAPVIWSLSDEARHHLREAYENHLANIETEMAAA